MSFGWDFISDNRTPANPRTVRRRYLSAQAGAWILFEASSNSHCRGAPLSISRGKAVLLASAPACATYGFLCLLSFPKKEA